MSKREKIIVILCLVVSVYGVADFLLFSNNKNNQKTELSAAGAHETTINFAAQAMSQFSKIELLMRQTHGRVLVEKIESDWERDPFVQTLKVKSVKVASPRLSLDVSNYIYSGYMAAGENSFAIINGVEYRTGETINASELKVIKITPKKVVLKTNARQAVLFLKEE